MFNVSRDIHFSYGHRLLDHPGKCAHLHGHNGRAQVEVSSEKLNQQGMVIDFDEIRKSVGQWIRDTFDHKTILQEKDPLVEPLRKAGEPIVIMKNPPTAENMARMIFQEARSLSIPVSRVTLWETPDSFASYHE